MQDAPLIDRPVQWNKARRAAEALLRKYDVTEPPVPVLTIAADEGLAIQYARFPERRAAVSGFIDTEQPKIVVNIAEPPQRQLFTVAHELGHWILHKEEVKDDKIYRVLKREALDKSKPAIEREADLFAASLLVPQDLLDRYWIETSVRPSRQSLARLFGVSEEMIGYRLKNYYGD